MKGKQHAQKKVVRDKLRSDDVRSRRYGLEAAEQGRAQVATKLTWVSFVCCLLATVANGRGRGRRRGGGGLSNAWG